MPTEQRLDPRQDRAMLWANRENVQNMHCRAACRG